MPIQQLSVQVTNQIAAGEVVERPASVVKELVENSIDAGATRIEIDIEQGGSRLIRIRDNGCGIPGDELSLALMRHATSKIATLDDLQAINSFGFRGEALASISSVSRLTLTSCASGQQQAWQSYAEGRDMQATVTPAAHPPGSTLEVRDLFYNTPARRKFLRTEKTEFMHIDEVIRRIALARFDITFILTHNGKTLRQYRAVPPDAPRERRLEAICGAAFMREALEIEWQHGDLALHGWVSLSAVSEEIQYSYVNERMIRDRLITHAIRQAYEQTHNATTQAGWILFLTVDPQQVDVNVHPAKHEVRFHQSRLVHDFICQGVTNILHEQHTSAMPGIPTGKSADNRPGAGKNSFHEPPAGDYLVTPPGRLSPTSPGEQPPVSQRGALSTFSGSRYQPRQQVLYQQLINTAASSDSRPANQINTADTGTTLLQPVSCHAIPSSRPVQPSDSEQSQSFGRVLSVIANSFALLERDGEILLLNLSCAARQLCQKKLCRPGDQDNSSQPLLIPLRLKISSNEQRRLVQCQPELKTMGIDISLDTGYITICALPLPLRQQNLHILIPELIGYLVQQATFNMMDTASWLAQKITDASQSWTAAQAITLLAQLERDCPSLLATMPADLLQLVDLQPVISALRNE